MQDILREACIFRPKISSGGVPCIRLPPRTDHDTHRVALSDAERELYACTPGVLELSQGFAIMMRLRQGVFCPTRPGARLTRGGAACLEPRLLLAALDVDEEEEEAIREDDAMKLVSKRCGAPS